jgi:uncharacterized membrane protein YGL010W
MHDDNEEPYVEYLQPTFLIMMAALKMGLRPELQSDIRSELIIAVRSFFGHISSVALYISGTKMD